MERDSLFYKLRRKGQVLAHKILPDKFLCQLYSKVVLGHYVNLDNPQTFNEKIQWLKINDYPHNELVIKCCDKYSVRGYIEQKGYGDLLVPLHGAWNKAEDIEWEDLPQQFVLKCSHGCAYNIVCADKFKLDKNATITQLNKWLQEDFGAFNVELQYSGIKERKITCEEFLGECITDYKFFCFNGEPKFMYVSNDLIHDRQAQIGFFYVDGKKMPLIRDDYATIDEIRLPSYFEKMYAVAKELSREFCFVRVDFFALQDKFYFAELTFTPAAGMMPFNPDKFDLEWGKMIKLPKQR